MGGRRHRPVRNARASRSKSAGRSSVGMWATSGQTSSRAPSTSVAIRVAASFVAGWSRSPTRTNVGQRISASRSAAAGLSSCSGFASGIPFGQLERVALHPPDERPDLGIHGVRAARRAVDPGPEVDLDRARRGRPGRAPRPPRARPGAANPRRRRGARRRAPRAGATRPHGAGRGPPRPRSPPPSTSRREPPGPAPARRSGRAGRRGATTARPAAGSRRSLGRRSGRPGRRTRTPATGDPTSGDRRRPRGRGRSAGRRPRSSYASPPCGAAHDC